MTSEQTKKLAELLSELKKSELIPPNTPFEVWKELMTILPAPAVEVLITSNGKDFLLTERHDRFWDGWHIPGGFMLAKETVGDACNRIAKTELGIEVDFKKVLMVYTWPEHPYANAVSIVCICSPRGEPTEGKYYSMMPEDTIETHKLFIQKFLEKST